MFPIVLGRECDPRVSAHWAAPGWRMSVYIHSVLLGVTRLMFPIRAHTKVPPVYICLSVIQYLLPLDTVLPYTNTCYLPGTLGSYVYTFQSIVIPENGLLAQCIQPVFATRRCHVVCGGICSCFICPAGAVPTLQLCLLAGNGLQGRAALATGTFCCLN
ncbi:hypothetical protein XENTR_v10010745 [Xenopus tropicalis]|nr:hypothetical protein XENTR_v10010745 [Xenopus tropicalis]